MSFGVVFFNHLQNLRKGDCIFYDLGSGTGRGVFAAAMLHDFSKLIGIEVLDGLHRMSKQIYEDYRNNVLPKLPESKKNQKIDFVRCDFRDFDWSDGDLIFANSTW